jgi:hypothetical protein
VPKLIYTKGTTTTVGEREEPKYTSWALDSTSAPISERETEFRDAGEGWLCVSVEGADTESRPWVKALSEAISVGTAVSLWPICVEEYRDGVRSVTLQRGQPGQPKSALTPPFTPRGPQQAHDFWIFVQKFAEYSLAHAHNETSLWAEIEDARMGGTISFHAACLTLAVAIEAIVGLLESSSSKGAVSKEDCKLLLSCIEGWEAYDKWKDRVNGLVGSLRSPRPVDVLYEWVDVNGFDKSWVDAWRRLRNKRAHGHALRPEQHVLDDYYRVVELLYRLVAEIIGYRGVVQETSKSGWGDPFSTVQE